MKGFFEVSEKEGEVENKSIFNIKENSKTKIPDWVNNLTLLKSKYDEIKNIETKINFLSQLNYDERLQYLLAIKYYSSEFWLLINNFKKEYEDLKSFDSVNSLVINDEDFEKIPDSLKLIYLEEILSKKYKLSDSQKKFYFESLKRKYKNLNIKI